MEAQRNALAAVLLALQALADPAQGDERRRACARELATREAAAAAIPGAPLSAEDAYRAQTEREGLQAALPGLRERERALLRELAVLEEAERDLVDLEDGAAYWAREEARAREEEQVLLLARALLLEAGQTAHASFAEPLAARIAPLFAAMTGGRYPRVVVHPDAQRFQAHPLDRGGTPVPPEQLSRGAGDQFTLAVRLALGQVVAGPAGTPIFLLDDPLLHFDADRRREALALLRDLAGRAQIVLATHDASLRAALPDAAAVELSAVRSAG